MNQHESDNLGNDYAASFRELRTYKASLDLSLRVFEMTRGFPREEIYSLTDQVRRSSRSVGTNLAEAWAKRRYPAAFLAKLSDSLGEVFETQAWLDQSLQSGYISTNTHQEIDTICTLLGAMLRSMENKVDSFCGPRS